MTTEMYPEKVATFSMALLCIQEYQKECKRLQREVADAQQRLGPAGDQMLEKIRDLEAAVDVMVYDLKFIAETSIGYDRHIAQNLLLNPIVQKVMKNNGKE